MRDQAMGNRILSIAILLLCGSQAFPQTEKQNPRISLEIGAPLAEGGVGEIIEIPVIITSDSTEPSVVILLLQFDDALLDFQEARLGVAVPDEKVIDVSLFPGDETELATVSLIAFGIDQITIPDGNLFVLSFDIMDEGPTGVIPLVVDRASATTALAQSFDVTFTDGAIDLSCPDLTAPTGVAATTDRSDGVLVIWNALENAIEYRVYRGAADSQDPESAAPIVPWFNGVQFNDTNAPAPLAVGCAVQPVSSRYWVKARVREFCESPFGGPATGTRISPETKIITQSASLGGTISTTLTQWANAALMLAAALLTRLVPQRHRRSNSGRGGHGLPNE